MCYGGCDLVLFDFYLSFDSFELVLQKGFELYEQWKEGNGFVWEVLELFYLCDMFLFVEKEVNCGCCVECYMIGDYQVVQFEFDGKFDKVKFMFLLLDFKKFGIEFDVFQGLFVSLVSGMVEVVGLQLGDMIIGFEEYDVYIFGDLQYWFGKYFWDVMVV